MPEATPRFKLPYPTDGAPGWWQQFSDLATGLDALLFGVMEATDWTFAALPLAHIDALGGGAYALVLDGPLVVTSRTLQTPITVAAGSLTLLADHLIVVTIPAGATAAAAATLSCVQNAVTIDPTVRVLGYVAADASIIWWNAATLEVGTTRRLFAHGVPGGDLVLPVTAWTYWGDATTNGSYRIGVVGGDMLIQKRVTGTWTTCQTITPP